MKPVALHQAPHTAALLDQLGRRMRLRSEDGLAGVGLRPRHLVALTVLRDHEGVTQQALASSLQMDRSNLVGLLNELEDEGLVARRRSPQDRRCHVVTLTPAGGGRLREAEAALTAAEDDVLAALEPEQRQALYALLRQATRATSSGAPRTGMRVLPPPVRPLPAGPAEADPRRWPAPS